MADTAYITTATIQEFVKATKLRQILEKAADFDLATSPILDRAIATANSRVDAAVRTRYLTPLDSDAIPAMLAQAAADIAVFQLLQFTEKESDDDRARYEETTDMLNQIGRGELSLELPTAEATAKTRITVVGLGSAHRLGSDNDSPPSVFNESWRTQGRY